VTGFDPADQARRLGVQLTTLVLRDDQFEFGTEQWDLIVLSYVVVRRVGSRVYEALRPGDLVVVEGFHCYSSPITQHAQRQRAPTAAPQH
jgi:hypothetical protein